LNLGLADVSWPLSAGYVGQLIGAPIGGSLAERFGRRPVIVAVVLWFGLSIRATMPIRRLRIIARQR
jgi:MFS family permease